jgi:hypothetical protein
MNKSIALMLLTVVAVAAFVAWRVLVMRNGSVNHFGILHDPSISYTGGCDSLVGSAEQLLHESGVSPRSKVMVLVLGDGTTAYEPRELGKYDVPISRRVIEGRKANERQQAALLREISKTCNSVRPTSISPIFMGVRQAIADLRAEGCVDGSRCKLRVDSDLEENVETGIKSGLDRTRRREPLPEVLDNDGIDVTFCGYAATAGRILDPTGREVRRFTGRNPAREDRMQEIWRSVFASPERVKFEPYCPRPNNPGAYTTARLSSRRADAR